MAVRQLLEAPEEVRTSRNANEVDGQRWRALGGVELQDVGTIGLLTFRAEGTSDQMLD